MVLEHPYWTTHCLSKRGVGGKGTVVIIIRGFWHKSICEFDLPQLSGCTTATRYKSVGYGANDDDESDGNF